MGLCQEKANKLTPKRATCGQQRDLKNFAPEMSALSANPTQAWGLEKTWQGALLFLWPGKWNGPWNIFKEGPGSFPLCQSYPCPGNRGTQFDLFHFPPPTPHPHINVQSILRTSWRDSESFYTILDPLGPFLGQAGWGVEQHFSSPIIVIGFISTLFCGQAPMCLFEY